ncbi:MAG: Hsp20/alpha crystallin family protein [Gammaproteobacteria bacterium]|nr:Hsp20/alpha crystallin family protein [Gammaproteobacteria bacterium]
MSREAQKIAKAQEQDTATTSSGGWVHSPLEEMERMFESLLPRHRLWPGRWEHWNELAAPFDGRLPKVDVLEKDDKILVRAEIPGVKKEDLDLSVTDNSVTIKASTRRDEEAEEGDYHRREISTGSYTRTVSLPSAVDSGAAKASFNDGVLELSLPKTEKTERRTIKVE